MTIVREGKAGVTIDARGTASIDTGGHRWASLLVRLRSQGHCGFHRRRWRPRSRARLANRRGWDRLFVQGRGIATRAESRRSLSPFDRIAMFKFLHAADIHLDSPQRGLDRY